MTVVTFAVSQESTDFRRTLREEAQRLDGSGTRVVHLGIGPVAAASRIRELLAAELPDAVLCAGFAGGLDPRVQRTDLIIADNYSSPRLRARAQALTGKMPHRFFGPLVTRPEPVETAEAKSALARETGALAVDMETAAVAEACAAAGIPMLSVRAISDAADASLPVPFAEWYDLQRQRPRRWALLRYLLRHPERVGPFADFIRGLAPARRALADFLIRFLQQPSSRER